MNVPFSNLYAQYEQIKEEIDEVITRTIRDSAFIGGQSVKKFEYEYRKTIGTEYCISCANGTDALYIAMRALGIKSGDEVITTGHSWFSTSEAISQAGGIPVFCDTETSAFCINSDLIEEKITERTVGIVPVHLYGHPAEMYKIMKIASRHSLWVVEDCAQAHLASTCERNVGTFGNASTFSFYPGKNLGAMGDAGAILTNDQELAEWCSLFANHGGKGRHLFEGINSRMDGLQAGILAAKLPYLAAWTEKRINVAKYYSEKLSKLSELVTPIERESTYSVYHQYTVLCDDRDGLKGHLEENGVETHINYPVGLPFLPAYSKMNYRPDDFPVVHSNQARILSLPIYPELKKSEQDYVIQTIYSYYTK